MSNTLIETICIRNRRVQRIEYHNDRCNNSRKDLFNESAKINLRKYIDTSRAEGLTKCRISYKQDVVKVEYESYTMRTINSLKLLDISDYTYSHKYADRSRLDLFFKQRGDADDILMIKNGLITDTYYANVALLKHGIWYTPEKPLLNGTMRSYLLEKGNIIPANIKSSELQGFESIRLFNALIGFGNIEISIANVKY